jgi:nucleoside-diphosphate-sugar epimerase
MNDADNDHAERAMKILILGGTRFIGKAAAERAAASGHEVVLFNRGKTRSDSPYQTITGDVDQLKEHASALRDLRPDVVIHAIAYTEAHARDVVDVFAGIGPRLIVLSSQDCYEAFYQLNHGRDVAELPLAEDAQLCARRYYWAGRPGTKTYPDYDKNLVTSAILSAHAEGRLVASVLRLPMVFGPGDFQFRHRHGKFIRRLYDRQPVMVMGAVEQSSLFTFGFIDNIAAAIVHAVETPVVDGKVFNVGETKSRSLRRWAELYAEAAGSTFEFSILPDAMTEQDAAAINNPPRLLQFDATAFERQTGFADPVPLSEQIQRTLAWGLEHVDALGPKPDYDSERALVESYRGFLANALGMKEPGRAASKP